MNKYEKSTLIATPFVILLGYFLGIVGSSSENQIFGIDLYLFIVLITYLIQYIVFIPSYIFQTEKYFDITASLTYIFITIFASFSSIFQSIKSLTIAVMVLIWASRLGAFLFKRVHVVGKDVRFDEAKKSFIRFFGFWNLQALWITFTSIAALVVITSNTDQNVDIYYFIGVVIWSIGFYFEVVSDSQKMKFKMDESNNGKFISSGLWSISRHPNYFGEIMIWLGVAIIAFPVLSGFQYFALSSPVFVYLLLTRASGIPILEKNADKKWGGQEAYEEYKKNTPVLIPKLFS